MNKAATERFTAHVIQPGAVVRVRGVVSAHRSGDPGTGPILRATSESPVDIRVRA
jgi:hypothetical protein